MTLQPAQVLAQRLLQLLGGLEESIVRGPLPQQLPQSLDDVELRTVAGEPQ